MQVFFGRGLGGTFLFSKRKVPPKLFQLLCRLRHHGGAHVEGLEVLFGLFRAHGGFHGAAEGFAFDGELVGGGEGSHHHDVAEDGVAEFDGGVGGVHEPGLGREFGHPFADVVHGRVGGFTGDAAHGLDGPGVHQDLDPGVAVLGEHAHGLDGLQRHHQVRLAQGDLGAPGGGPGDPEVAHDRTAPLGRAKGLADGDEKPLVGQKVAQHAGGQDISLASHAGDDDVVWILGDSGHGASMGPGAGFWRLYGWLKQPFDFHGSFRFRSGGGSGLSCLNRQT